MMLCDLHEVSNCAYCNPPAHAYAEPHSVRCSATFEVKRKGTECAYCPNELEVDTIAGYDFESNFVCARCRA